jgi:hypothetical protein
MSRVTRGKRVTNKKNKVTPLARSALAGLRQAAKQARKTARMYGTPVIYLKDGKVVRERV